MLELTPSSAPGEHHGRVSVFVMEPGGTLWLWRFDAGRRRIEHMIIPRPQLPRLRAFLASRRTDDRRDLPLVRRTQTRTQRLTIPAADVDRVREAIRELFRFEADPSLPEWKTRGYLTAEEAEAIADAHPEWFTNQDDDPGPGPG
jgi:hypothetical protein